MAGGLDQDFLRHLGARSGGEKSDLVVSVPGSNLDALLRMRYLGSDCSEVFYKRGDAPICLL